MEIDRRSLMKGVLASGALLALGGPSWTFADQFPRRPKQCSLLLGGTSADDLFKSGARAACAAMTYEDLRTVQLKDSLLTGTDTIIDLLNQSRGARWIVVLDDAGAVMFLERARSAGVRMLSMGMHANSFDGSCHLRHDLTSISPAHSVGGLLGSHFIKRHGSFSITETFLREPREEGALTSWSAPGFSSYRSGEPEAIHMHCSGLSLQEGGRLFNVETSEGWVSIPQQVGRRETVTWQADNWIESVGYALTVSALGVESIEESCSGRAFVHQPSNNEQIQPMERFVSFVMDI